MIQSLTNVSEVFQVFYPIEYPRDNSLQTFQSNLATVKETCQLFSDTEIISFFLKLSSV